MNFTFLMLEQNKEATKKSIACLPYGMVFTLIFSKFRVSLEGEDAKRLLHTNHYNELSLHRIGYHKIKGR